jgi:hypothetical protein
LKDALANVSRFVMRTVHVVRPAPDHSGLHVTGVFEEAWRRTEESAS